MVSHLAFTKWRESAFSTEQLRSNRWLLNARPRNAPDNFRDILTVSPMAQAMLMELHIHVFQAAIRRMTSKSATARSRIRATVEDFEKLVDFACIFAALRQEARRVCAAADFAEVDQKLLATFLAKHLDLHDFFRTATIHFCLTVRVRGHMRICCQSFFCWAQGKRHDKL